MDETENSYNYIVYSYSENSYPFIFSLLHCSYLYLTMVQRVS